MLVLAACGDESTFSELVGGLLTLGFFAGWLVATVLIVRAISRDRSERRLLTGLLVASFVLGPLIIAAFYAGYFGGDGDVGKLALLLLIPGVLGAGIAHLTKAAHIGKAFFVSSWGAVSLVGLEILLLIAVLLLGGELCLE
jgi:hypothetical protein